MPVVQICPEGTSFDGALKNQNQKVELYREKESKLFPHIYCQIRKTKRALLRVVAAVAATS